MGTVPIFQEENGDSPLTNKRSGKPATSKRISIFGLGYVGAVSLACLARDGHQVIGVDIDPVKLELIRARRSPILEEGIQELMRRRGRIRSRDRDRRRLPGGARQRGVLHLRGHAIRGQWQPGPESDSPARRADRRGARHQARVPHRRGALDGAARHRRRADRTHPRAGQRPEVWRRLRPGVPAGIPARGQLDPRLRSSSIHDCRRQLRSGGRRGARHLPAPGHTFPGHQHPRGRSAEDELQRVSCAQDHLRQ